jgi:hypothetical protein
MTVKLKPRALRALGSLFTAGLIAAAAASSAGATSVLVDSSPVGNNNGVWSNTTDGQNFLVQFTLGSAASISEFDIYTFDFLAHPGTSVTLRLRGDDGGTPGVSNLAEFATTLSNVSGSGPSTLAGASFAPINLAAGTYWMGLSGTPDQLGWSSFDGIAQNSYQLGGETLQLSPFFGLAFRVVGNAGGNGAVPEPASWAMMVGGFGLIGAAMRRRQRTAVRFA